MSHCRREPKGSAWPELVWSQGRIDVGSIPSPVCVSLCVCIFMCVCACLCVCECESVCLSVCVCVRAYLCVCVCVLVCVSVTVCVCARIFVCACACVRVIPRGSVSPVTPWNQSNGSLRRSESFIAWSFSLSRSGRETCRSSQRRGCIIYIQFI